MRNLLVVLALAAACLSYQPRALGQQPIVLQAMQEEMKRAMDGLRLKDEPAPYYIAYAIDELAGRRIQTKLGTVVVNSSNRMRLLRVDVRVGDYKFDSSRFLSFDRDPGQMSMLDSVSAPLDDDYDVMRRQMWLATDTAYKRAVQTLSRKKAAAQTRSADPDEPPDFSREPPGEHVRAVSVPSWIAPSWLEDLRKTSAVFTSYPQVHGSDVTFEETWGTRYFLNSEGFKVVQPTRQLTIRLTADTQAADGMPVRDSFSVLAGDPKDLPTAADLLKEANELAARLTATREAPAGEDFTGPVLVEGEAAGGLIAQTFVPLFLSQRPPEADRMMASIARAGGTPFLTRIGSRVLPDAFSVSDTPSLQQFSNVTVPGAYAVDDEGIAAKDVKLVQDGKLLTLLTGRTPQKNLLQSNGHARYGGAQAGVFQVESVRAIPAAELKAKYLQMLKEQGRAYGYIIRAVLNVRDLAVSGEDMASLMGLVGGGGATRLGPPVARAVKLLPDGSEQTVRGLLFANVQPATFRTILEASRERTLYSYVATPIGIGIMSGGTMSMLPAVVSTIVPNLLLEEVEIQRSQETRLKPPIVPSPIKR